MTDPTEQDEFDDVSPGEAFTLLGNEIRIDIIQALGEISDTSLSFSTLRDHVNVADSGQFNYHLKELVGSFIQRTDEGAYELTYAGEQVIGAIFSGTFNQRGTPRTFDLASSCTICGSALLAEYEHEHVTISCPACDDQISTFGFPRARSRTALTANSPICVRYVDSVVSLGVVQGILSHLFRPNAWLDNRHRRIL